MISKGKKVIKSTPAMPKPPITVEEMKTEELEILKCVQQHHFAEEFHSLTQSANNGVPHVKKNSCLWGLNPILINGLLGVGGRLDLASELFDSKHQIILPKNDHVSNLLVEHYHQIFGHSGKKYVVSVLRERFWIVKVGSAVKRVLSRCVDCWRCQGLACEQKMTDLPVNQLFWPFSSVAWTKPC